MPTMSSNYILPQGCFKGGYFIILWPISKGLFQLAWHFGRRHRSKKKPVQRCPSLFGAEIRQRFVQSQWVFLYTNYIFNNACEWTIPNPPNFGSLNHFGPKKLQGGTHVSPFFTQKMSQIPRSLKEQDRKTSGTPGRLIWQVQIRKKPPE